MTKSQKEQLKKHEQELQTLYWQLVDNKEIIEAKRLDTIIGKLQQLQKLY